MNHLNGLPYYTARETGAIYIRLPEQVAAVIDDGCDCAYCKAHPGKPARWDTLVVPGGNDERQAHACDLSGARLRGRRCTDHPRDPSSASEQKRRPKPPTRCSSCST